MKKILLFMTLAFALAACGQQAPQARTAASGDTVSVNYVGTFENETLFDTNVRSVAEANNMSKQAYEPLKVTIGEGQVIPGFENALIGMQEGENKTVTLSPMQAYGERSEGKSFWLSLSEDTNRSAELQRIVTPTIEQMEQFDANSEIGVIVDLPGTDISYEVVDKDNRTATLRIMVEEGDKLQLPNTPWNSTVTEVNNETYVVRQDPPNGSIANTAMGPARFIVSGDTLTRVLMLEEGGQLQTQQGAARVKEVNGTHALLDYNHPLAGQTLVFEIEVVDII